MRAGVFFARYSLLVLLVALTFIDKEGLKVVNMSVDLPTLFLFVQYASGLLVISFISQWLKFDPRVVTFMRVESSTLAFMILNEILSYILVALHRPMVDDPLAAADRALGFNWLALYLWTTTHNFAHSVLIWDYTTFQVQMPLILSILCWRGQLVRAWELFWLFLLSCFGCLFALGIWPTIGPFGHFPVTFDTSCTQEFRAVYEGSLKVIGKTPLQGLIQFPSLHAAAAIIFTYAGRGIPILFPLLVVVNALMLVALLPIGGHYLVDMFGGVAIAVAAIVGARKIVTKETTIRTAVSA